MSIQSTPPTPREQEPTTPREQERVDALRRYAIIDTEAEPLYDDLAMLAARMCDSEFAAVSFVDETRCWLKAAWGMPAAAFDRADWFCDRAIGQTEDVTVIADASLYGGAKQPYPGVAGKSPFVFYAGAPIVTADGFALGTVCVLDTKPRDMSREQVLALQVLSRQAMSLLDLRRSNALLEMASIKMQMLVDRDGVTGLPSERMFRTQLRTEFQYARRHNQPLSLVLLDVDDFTEFNSNYGRERGDEILKRIARLIGRDTRDYDMVARSGSDEFGVVMRNAGSATGLSVANRIRSRIASLELAREPVMLSVGVSTITPDMISSRDLIDRARTSIRDSRHSISPVTV